jgi:hypothetical protein
MLNKIKANPAIVPQSSHFAAPNINRSKDKISKAYKLQTREDGHAMNSVAHAMHHRYTQKN